MAWKANALSAAMAAAIRQTKAETAARLPRPASPLVSRFAPGNGVIAGYLRRGLAGQRSRFRECEIDRDQCSGPLSRRRLRARRANAVPPTHENAPDERFRRGRSSNAETCSGLAGQPLLLQGK